MTARELVNSPAAKLLAWGAAFGIAYATLQAQVTNKAEKAEVAELRAAMAQMASDVRILRLIACKQATADTFCRGLP